MESRAFTEIYMPLGENLYRVAYYILESEQEARDAVQDIFVKLWNNRDALDTVHNPKAYAVTLMRNYCIDRIRRESKMKQAELKDTVMSDSDTFVAVSSRESLSKALAAVERLPKGQREVLKMKVFEDLSYDEMSERTGMNKLTLRVLLSQARKKIRQTI